MKDKNPPGGDSLSNDKKRTVFLLMKKRKVINELRLAYL